MEILQKTQVSRLNFQETRDLTVRIVSGLLPEDTVPQPIEDVSPPKWHLAHSTWFFEAFVLSRYEKRYKPFNEKYHYLFNSYYDSLGERVSRVNRGNVTRPSLSEILQYRNYVDEQMKEFLLSEPDESVLNIIELGLNHEQQHQELLVTDIKYIMGHQPLMQAWNHNNPHHDNGAELREPEWLTIPEGVYEAGYDGDKFSFDNEHSFHKVYLKAFSIMNSPVTNGEFIEFINDNGYDDFRHWTSDGHAWVLKERVSAPLYWQKNDDGWSYYTPSGIKPVDHDAPVCHISWYEADAFARWKGMRLPTEFEWEIAARKFSPEPSRENNWLNDFRLLPVDLNTSDHFSGNIWEWTNSAYLAYPGYRQESGALGEYNGKWMSGQMVLRGGSCATPYSHYRHSYRNFFQPEKRWQFSGVRLAKDA